MTRQFYCPFCQTPFSVDKDDIDVRYSMNGSSRLVAYHSVCNSLCDELDSGKSSPKNQSEDDIMAEILKKYGGGCGGGGCCG